MHIQMHTQYHLLNVHVHVHVGCVREFTAEEVKVATDDFTNEIGRGGFGTVFRGTLKHLAVAVKVLNKVHMGGLCACASPCDCGVCACLPAPGRIGWLRAYHRREAAAGGGGTDKV